MMKKPALLQFSHSRMSLYRECPMKYKFRYIDKLPEEPKPYFAFGSSIHSALEFLYDVKEPPFPALPAVLAAFKKDWESLTPEQKGYTDPAKADADYANGLEMLQAYYKKHKATLSVPVSVEFRTKVPVDGLDVTVIVDRIDHLGGGKIRIVDYKTGKHVSREPDQLYMYQKILESSAELRYKAAMRTGAKESDISVDQLVFYHVPSLSEDVSPRATDREIAAFWEKALVVGENIRAAKFDPQPEERKCRFCDFKSRCPIYGGGAGPSPSQSDFFGGLLSEPPHKAAADVLQDKAAAYVALLEKISALDEQALSLKKELAALMAEKNVHSLEAGGCSVVLEQLSGLEVPDRKALVKTLRETGLYEKALALTPKSIMAVLSDEALPPPVKDKISALVKISRRGDVSVFKK
ncbi:MAG: PD-(D/E)XK nuclease family protein [Elusimicrobia bacterium]|nr:PD-(D/E)XK nuclease family protein [Elusimicrobiota bacterium]